MKTSSQPADPAVSFSHVALRRTVAALLFACCFCSIGPAAAQSSVATPDTSLGGALRNLASRAAVVFVGQVTGIQREDSVVEIAFRVETPVLGNAPASYTLREWAGLWPPGLSRYHVGERAMLFLHGGSSAGLSSPVDGQEGIVPVTHGSDGTLLLDCRWLATRIQRAVGDPLPDASQSGVSVADAVQIVQQGQSSTTEPVRRPLPPLRKPNNLSGATMELRVAGSAGPIVLRPVQQMSTGTTVWRAAAASETEANRAQR